MRASSEQLLACRQRSDLSRLDERDKIDLHVLSRADVMAGVDVSLADPEGIATLGAEKREALLTNPLALDRHAPLRIIATDANSVVGRIDIVSGRLAVGTLCIPCLWGSALHVSEATKNSGVGLLLILKLQELQDTVGACGVSQAAYPIYQRLRWFDCSLPRLVLPLRSTPILRRYLGRDLPAAVLAPVVNVGFRLVRTGLGTFRPRGMGGLRYELAEQVPLVLDELLAPSAGAVAAHRSVRWLEWLLASSFDAVPPVRRGLYVVRDDGGDIVAYFLLKARRFEVASQRRIPDLLLGSVQDWMVFDRRKVDLEHVLVLAARELISWDVDAIEICVPRSHDVRLRRYGFVPAGALRLLIKARPPSALAREGYQRHDVWNLKSADGDNFYS